MYLTTNFETIYLSIYHENTFIKMDRYVLVLCKCYQFGEVFSKLCIKNYLATQKYDYTGSTWHIYFIKEITEVSVRLNKLFTFSINYQFLEKLHSFKHIKYN